LSEHLLGTGGQQEQSFLSSKVTRLFRVRSNVANHKRQKAKRGTSGAFCRPSAFALLGYLWCHHILNLVTTYQTIPTNNNIPGMADGSPPCFATLIPTNNQTTPTQKTIDENMT
jgi:hypothetical protein